jgi:hypothetical protein
MQGACDARTRLQDGEEGRGDAILARIACGAPTKRREGERGGR